MSDTPRTDAAIVVSVYGDVRVPVEVARELERELNNAIRIGNDLLRNANDNVERLRAYIKEKLGVTIE